MPDDYRPREVVSQRDVEAEIRAFLQGVSNPARGATGRETFAIVAEVIARHLQERGYEVTMRRTAPPAPSTDRAVDPVIR